MDKLMNAANSASPKINIALLQFIHNFRNHLEYEDCEESIRRQFMTGYCYAFALILKDAYQGGTVCWAAPYGHVIYLYDGCPYDIEGVYDGDALYFIPMSETYRLVYDFRHLPGVVSGLSKSDKIDIIKEYCTRHCVEYNPIVEDIV